MHADELNSALSEEYGNTCYSLLQDSFFQYMSDSGYRGFICGIKCSTKEHLTDLEFKIKKETEKYERKQKGLKEKIYVYQQTKMNGKKH